MVQAAQKEANLQQVVCCQSKSKIRDMVTRVAAAFKAQQQVIILGRGSTISKAISVTEIVKRHLENDEDSICVEQETRIFKKEFKQGKAPESCIEIKLSLNERSEDVNSKLEQLIEQLASDKVINHERLPNARHTTAIEL